MPTVLIAPDKFKSCLTAEAVSRAIAAGFEGTSFSSVIVPLADGGEGTVALLTRASGGKLISLEVNDPLMRRVVAEYGYSESDQTAFIEMASAAGLWRLRPEEYNPERTTTYGIGEMVLDAQKRGADHIIIGCGGSATNDAALGMAEALGFRFYNREGDLIHPNGGNLAEIIRIDSEFVNPKIKSIRFTVISDVKNILTGVAGAAYVFGPQKGADQDSVQRLDAGLENIREVFKNNFGLDVNDVSGSGAGGGFPAGVMSLLNARIISGIEFIMEQLSFEDKVQQADLVITGEGQLDNQSLNGKVVSGVAALCSKYNKPLWIVCGKNISGNSEFKSCKIISLTELAEPDEDTFLNASALLTKAIQLQLMKS